MKKAETAKTGNLANAAKVVALCLAPVVLSLVGLAALSRRQRGGLAHAAGKAGAVRSTGEKS
jgi:hypothetical protein